MEHPTGLAFCKLLILRRSAFFVLCGSQTDWKDYELLDCGGGEKLERWDKQILVRPDPQAIWDTPSARTAAGKRMTPAISRSSTGRRPLGQDGKLPESWNISYKDLTFQVKPMNFKHTGVFPEQAVNWDFAMEKIETPGRPIRVLNLFAYTGGATVACAAAGASVCHVDAAKGMVAWGKENAGSAALATAPIRWIVDDCAKFVEREIRRGNTYDAIIMDPPSYGRGPGGEVWKLEDNAVPLCQLCARRCCRTSRCSSVNSYTTGLAPSVLEYMLQDHAGARQRRQGHLGRAGPARDRQRHGAALRRHGPLVAASKQEPKIRQVRWTDEISEKPGLHLPRRTEDSKTSRAATDVSLEVKRRELCGRAGPQRLRQIHAGQALQRHAAAEAAARCMWRAWTPRTRRCCWRSAARGHGVPEPGQPDRGQRGGGGCGLRAGESGCADRGDPQAGGRRPGGWWA